MNADSPSVNSGSPAGTDAGRAATRASEAYVEARSEEIIAAAMRTFVRKGLDGATMQDIASEAGLSAGALYRYFDSKDRLVRAVFDACEAQNTDLFGRALAAAAGPVDALIYAGRIVWDQFATEGALDQFTVNLEAALAASRDDDAFALEYRRRHAQVREQMAEIVRQAQAAGEIDPAVDANGLALTLLACVEGIRVLYVETRGSVETEPVFEVLSRMVRDLARKEG